MHEIETHGTQAAAIFAREDAWHRLGTTVKDRAFTAEEAMTLGHLGGWNVRKVALQASELSDEGVTLIEVPGKYATVRSNPFTGAAEALGVVGESYTPLQNEESAEFLNVLTDEFGAAFDTAGSLRGGRQTFITMKLPESLAIGGHDRVDLNIAALNGHDGNNAFRLLITPVRVVCANTQAAAIRDHVASWSIRHTRNAKTAVQQARAALGLTYAYVEAFQAEAERMIEAEMDRAAFAQLIEASFGKTPADASPRTLTGVKKRDHTLRQLFTYADTQAEIRGTAWAGYQALAEYVDHFAPIRGAAQNAQEARATRVLTSEEPGHIKRRAWAHLAANLA